MEGNDTSMVYCGLCHHDLCCKKSGKKGYRISAVILKSIITFFFFFPFSKCRMSVAAYCVFCCRKIGTSGPAPKQQLPWNDISKYSSLCIDLKC